MRLRAPPGDVLERVLPLRDALGDDPRRFRRFFAQARIAFDFALEADAFLAQEVAQALKLGDQALDLRHRGDRDALHDRAGVADDVFRGWNRLRFPLAIERNVPARQFGNRSFGRFGLRAFGRVLRKITRTPSRRNIVHCLIPPLMVPSTASTSTPGPGFDDISSAATEATLWPRGKRKRNESVNVVDNERTGEPNVTLGTKSRRFLHASRGGRRLAMMPLGRIMAVEAGNAEAPAEWRR